MDFGDASEEVLDVSFEDLLENVRELDRLAAGYVDRIEAFQKKVHVHRKHAYEGTIAYVSAEAVAQRAKYDVFRAQLADAERRINNEPHTGALLAELIRQRQEQMFLLHTLIGQTGALMVSLDWQSPSFGHSVMAQAGTQTGHIEGTINDYKRDTHLDEEAFEAAFKREYVNERTRLSVQVLATGSGMSAFTTVLAFLRGGEKICGPVVVGQSCWFQNKRLLEYFFGREQVHIVDEMNAEEVIAVVKRLQPRAIFLDTLCNTSTIPVPNLAKLIPALSSAVKQQAYLVLDNSGFGPTCRPLSYLPRLSRLRMLVVESLNKHYEFGLDRVAGGVVWGDGRFVGRLSTYRMHLGTNIPDASVHTVPWPDGALLRARMQRQGRNAQLIAEKIDAYVKAHPGSVVSHVVYPGLSTHPSSEWTKAFSFHGCFFSLAFKPTYAKVFVYLRYLAAVLSEAKKVKADVVTGTDFGLSTTRVYLTALHAQRMALPFVRISAGTETRLEAEVLAEVFIRAIDRLSKWAIIP